MAISLYGALVILQDWCSERRRVRFSFVGQGISLWCSPGAILEVSENRFIVGSEQLRTVIDIRSWPKTDFILLDDFKSVLPSEITERLDGQEKCALMFKSATGELAVVFT